MKEIRLHGRGGMGTVKATEIIVTAKVLQGGRRKDRHSGEAEGLPGRDIGQGFRFRDQRGRVGENIRILLHHKGQGHGSRTAHIVHDTERPRRRHQGDERGRAGNNLRHRPAPEARRRNDGVKGKEG